MEDSIIIDYFLARNEVAIFETKNKYGSLLRQLIYKITSSRESTEECESDTYLKLWNTIPPNTPRDYYRAYVLKVGRSVSVDRLRKDNSKKRSAEIEELTNELEQTIPSNINVENIVENRILVECLNEWLSRLSDYKRKIFIRRYFFMDTIEEISKDTGYSESRVKTVLFRCRKELARNMEKKGYE